MAAASDQAQAKKIEKSDILLGGAARDSFLPYSFNSRWKRATKFPESIQTER